MNAAVVIRRGTSADRDFVRDLGRRSADSSISAVRTAPAQDVASSFDRLLSFVFSRGHELLIAADGPRPIGFLVMLYDLPDEVTLADQAFVAYTAVEPAERGNGVGRALLDAAEIAARAAGLPSLSLMVTEENGPARRLYETSGFVTERRMMTKPL